MTRFVPIPQSEYCYDGILQERLDKLHHRVNQMWQDGRYTRHHLAKVYQQSKINELYHSNKIEGSSLTLGETQEVVLEGKEIPSKPWEDQLTARNLSRALDYAYKLAPDRERPITQNEVRRIHQLIMQDVQGDAGEYRSTQNIIKGSRYSTPEPYLVSQQMTELSDYIQSETSEAESRAASPILAAAVAHTTLARIHPFTDGNGRTARALLNVILMRRGYPPCIITEEDRPRYIDALEESHSLELTDVIELIWFNVNEYLDDHQWLAAVPPPIDQNTAQDDWDEFSVWRNAMNALKSQFRQVTDSQNALVNHHALSWKFADYGELDMQRYLLLRNGGRARKTWYFVIGCQSDEKRVRYVFAFAAARESIQERAPVVLEIAKNTTRGYVRLKTLYFDAQPDVYQIGFDLDSRKYISLGKAGIRERNLQSLVHQFFDQVIERDFGS